MGFRRLASIVPVTAFGILLSGAALGCSICRCGDPTFNALGKEGVAQSGLRLALDWESVQKSQGTPGEEYSEVREERSTLLVAYGVSDRLGLFARIPYSERRLVETDGGDIEHAHAAGPSDPELYGQLRLWSSRFEGDVGIRSSVYLVAGVKTNWGENNASIDGERLDEHVQPGTGSTDPFLGMHGSYQIDPRSALFASVQYRLTGRNDAGYRYGRITLVNLAYEHKLAERWDAVLEANYRYSGFDQVDSDGATDPDTGGSIIYLTPRLLFDAGRGWVLRLSAQVPLSNSGLNGHQKEKPVLNLGLTKLFAD